MINIRIKKNNSEWHTYLLIYKFILNGYRLVSDQYNFYNINFYDKIYNINNFDHRNGTFNSENKPWKFNMDFSQNQQTHKCTISWFSIVHCEFRRVELHRRFHSLNSKHELDLVPWQELFFPYWLALPVSHLLLSFVRRSEHGEGTCRN